jgi:xylitol oxidase
MIARERNWAGNHIYHAARLHRPQSLEELREIILRSSKVRALGTRHCFNDIADCTQDLISMQHFDRVLDLNRADQTVTVQPNIKYGQLGEFLNREGFALHNLASLPHIGIAGACATATHGSGETNGNLATAVRAMELMRGDGQSITLRQGDEHFDAAVVHLGGLGIVTKITLAIEPTFSVRQYVYEHLPLAELEKNFDAIQASAYSVSLFTDWRSDRINQVWLKRRVTPNDVAAASPTFFGAALAPVDRHPIVEISAENCTPQMGAAGPWHERLPHFRMNFTPRQRR